MDVTQVDHNRGQRGENPFRSDPLGSPARKFRRCPAESAQQRKIVKLFYHTLWILRRGGGDGNRKGSVAACRNRALPATYVANLQRDFDEARLRPGLGQATWMPTRAAAAWQGRMPCPPRHFATSEGAKRGYGEGLVHRKWARSAHLRRTCRGACGHACGRPASAAASSLIWSITRVAPSSLAGVRV